MLTDLSPADRAALLHAVQRWLDPELPRDPRYVDALLDLLERMRATAAAEKPPAGQRPLQAILARSWGIAGSVYGLPRRVSTRITTPSTLARWGSISMAG